MRVSKNDKTRYRNSKGYVTVSMLGVCDVNMNFHYMLSGWEGSASDSRVLRDAVSRQYGLKIPTGKYIITLDKLDS